MNGANHHIEPLLGYVTALIRWIRLPGETGVAFVAATNAVSELMRLRSLCSSCGTPLQLEVRGSAVPCRPEFLGLANQTTAQLRSAWTLV
jgi:hypothetical protein